MKNIPKVVLSLALFGFINSCSSNVNAQFYIRNEQLNKVSVKAKIPVSNKLSTDNAELGFTTADLTASIRSITLISVIRINQYHSSIQKMVTV